MSNSGSNSRSLEPVFNFHYGREWCCLILPRQHHSFLIVFEPSEYYVFTPLIWLSWSYLLSWPWISWLVGLASSTPMPYGFILVGQLSHSDFLIVWTISTLSSWWILKVKIFFGFFAKLLIRDLCVTCHFFICLWSATHSGHLLRVFSDLAIFSWSQVWVRMLLKTYLPLFRQSALTRKPWGFSIFSSFFSDISGIWLLELELTAFLSNPRSWHPCPSSPFRLFQYWYEI